MEHTQNFSCGFVCSCDHHAPSERLLRSPEFNRALAVNLAGWDVSVPALYDQMLSKLFDQHEGTLFENGEAIDLYAVDANGDDWIDRAFACGDIYRTIHRYLERADGGFKNRLIRSLIRPVLVMHFARAIAECTCGSSTAAITPEQSAD